MSKEKSNKPAILIFLNYYLPGTKFGGPVQSVSNIVDWLGEDYRFKIITLDRDFLSEQPYKDIEADEWNQIGDAQVFYLSPNNLSFTTIRRLLKSTNYDLLYLNSFFNPYFTLLPLFLEKVTLNKSDPKLLLAPRGELGRGALEQKKLKKKIFIQLSKWLGLFKKVNWHATNNKERDDIVRELGRDKKEIFIASNLPPHNSQTIQGVSKKEKRNLGMIYLSRITPKKNIGYMIDILKGIDDVKVKLDPFGTVDDQQYWKHCEKKIEELPPNIKVEYFGHLDHSEVLNTVSQYDVFVLPTKDENFGHAIVEAISVGTPVLISENTPWRNLEKKGVGWDYELGNPNKSRDKIKELAYLNTNEMNKIKREAKENYRKVVKIDSVFETRKMFQEIIDVDVKEN